MPIFVQYPGEDVFYLVAPGEKNGLADTFCGCTADAPVLPAGRRQNLSGFEGLGHPDLHKQPRVFLARQVEDLKNPGFNDFGKKGIGYISPEGTYLEAGDENLKRRLNKNGESALYNAGWVKVYRGDHGNTFRHISHHNDTASVPYPAQHQKLECMECCRDSGKRQFKQLSSVSALILLRKPSAPYNTGSADAGFGMSAHAPH